SHERTFMNRYKRRILAVLGFIVLLAALYAMVYSANKQRRDREAERMQEQAKERKKMENAEAWLTMIEDANGRIEAKKNPAFAYGMRAYAYAQLEEIPEAFESV